jgi:hypothetical protein
MDVNPTGVTLTLFSIDGNPSNEKVTHLAPFHMGGFGAVTIRTIQVGTRVAMYGNILKNVNGAYLTQYIHLRRGIYTFEKPIQILTFHADILK